MTGDYSRGPRTPAYCRGEVVADLLLHSITFDASREGLLQRVNQAVQRRQQLPRCSARQLGQQQVTRQLHIIVVLQPCESDRKKNIP